MSHEVTRVLQVVRTMISGGWCRYVDARDKHRRPVEPYDARATQFSLDGAVRRALAEMKLKNRKRTGRLVLAAITREIRVKVDSWGDPDGAYDHLEAFNDSVARSKHDVLRLLNTLLEGQGAIKRAPTTRRPALGLKRQATAQHA